MRMYAHRVKTGPNQDTDPLMNIDLAVSTGLIDEVLIHCGGFDRVTSGEVTSAILRCNVMRIPHRMCYSFWHKYDKADWLTDPSFYVKRFEEFKFDSRNGTVIDLEVYNNPEIKEALKTISLARLAMATLVAPRAAFTFQGSTSVEAYNILLENLGQFKMSQPVKHGTNRRQLSTHYNFNIFAMHWDVNGGYDGKLTDWDDAKDDVIVWQDSHDSWAAMQLAGY